MKPSDIFKFIKQTKYKTVGYDVQYAIFSLEKETLIIWEESTSKEDWKTNFDFPIRPYKNQQNTLWYHRGWAKAYKSARDEFLKDIADCSNTENFRIYGWSYGGAMSQISAEDVKFHYPNSHIEVVTFGSPNPLFGRKTKKFVKSCIADCKQYANRNDLVTVMPPLPGYKQVNKIKVGKKFNLIEFFKPKIYHANYDDESIYEEN